MKPFNHLPAFFIAILTMALLFSCEKGKKEISYKELPDSAKYFIADYFEFDSAVSIFHNLKESEYEINFSNESKVLFDENGIWQEVKTPQTEFPMWLFKTLPEPIYQYLYDNYPYNPVAEVSKESYGYKIEIGIFPDTEIQFDKTGKFLKEGL